MDNNDLSSVLGALMNDSRVAETVKQLKETLSDQSSSDVSPSKTDTEVLRQSETLNESFPDIGALARVLNASEKSNKGDTSETEKRNKLLSALKPYLRGSRRDVIDKVMSLSNLTELIDLLPKNNF